MKLEKPFSEKNLFWKTMQDKKEYYLGKDLIGGEYDVIKLLIRKGWSSARAHKIIDKIKEFPS